MGRKISLEHKWVEYFFTDGSMLQVLYKSRHNQQTSDDASDTSLIDLLSISASPWGTAATLILMTALKKDVNKIKFNSLKNYFYDTNNGYNWVFPMDITPYVKTIRKRQGRMLKGMELWRNAAKFC